MNLVILHPHILFPGGASKYMLEVASRLADRGLSITVILTEYDKRLVEPYKNIRFIEVGRWSTGEIQFWLTFPVFFLKLKKILDGIDNKILFPQIFPPAWWAVLYKFFSPKTTIIWMCHEPSAFIHSPLVIRGLKQQGRILAALLNPFLKTLDKIFVKKIDYIIVNSKYGQRLVENIYNREANMVAYPSVDLVKFKPLKKKENYIFTISRLDKQKNIDLLIKAFSLFPNEIFSKYKLIIGGEGTEKNNLEKMVRDIKLTSKVIFLGRVKEKELPSYYAKARLTVFLGKDEPFGIIPVESMACGTPVIALKSGGVVESVINGKTGFLMKEKDENELVRIIIDLLSNEKELISMSKQSRQHAIDAFSWDKTAIEIYDFIKRIFE